MLTCYRAAASAAVFAAVVFASAPAFASTDLGNGFTDHGVAVPISNHRGTVATVDGSGRNVVLSWLMDHRGGYQLLMVDAETGKAEEFPLPFNNEKKDSPYASILSSANRFYTHFGDYFVEFDPAKRAYTFHSKTTPQMSMGMTEDDNGVIWSVAYPQSAVVSYDPKSKKFRDFGNVYQQNWPQYQRYIAADDAGWVYFALGQTASQIVALDPVSGKAKAVLQEAERAKGSAYVYRDMDGKVYGEASKGSGKWIAFHKGERADAPEGRKRSPKPIITDSQALVHKQFPDGSRLDNLNLVDRVLTVTDAATSKSRSVPFDYKSEGAMVMGVATASDGTICGGTAFPMRFFTLDPKADRLMDRPAFGQWNTVAPHKNLWFTGGYPGGFLLEWDPAKPWVNTETSKTESNPKWLTKVAPTIHRPHCLLPLRDDKRVVMGGTPDYGYTGGGLLIWDRETSGQTLLEDKDLVPNQSAFSLVELADGKLLCGTTTSAGTGGEKKASEAVMYVLDLATNKIEWQSAVIPGTQQYTALHPGPDGLVYGFADRKTFFVFDPVQRKVVHQQHTEAEWGLSTYEQGPRVFVPGEGEALYVLFERKIARLDTKRHAFSLVVDSPVHIYPGGAYHEGKLYFATGSHLCSYKLPPGELK